MNTVKLYSELSDLNAMFTSVEMLRSRYLKTGKKEMENAANVLIDVEKERILQAYNSFVNNLAAEFWMKMNGEGKNVIEKTLGEFSAELKSE